MQEVGILDDDMNIFMGASNSRSRSAHFLRWCPLGISLLGILGALLASLDDWRMVQERAQTVASIHALPETAA